MTINVTMSAPEHGQAPVLEVEELSVRIPTSRGTVHAVTDVSFGIHAGELLAVLGESGCGKSATARAVLGLDRGTDVGGRIRLEGQDLTGLPERERRRLRGAAMSMIFQDALASLNPVISVGDQIVEAIRIDGTSRAAARRRAVELMSEVGIPDPARRALQFPHEFSGGMRQRAMIAMALARRPRILFADEPTTALDVTVQAQILELLEAYRVEHTMAVVLITHDLRVVATTADRIVVMYAGRIVESGPANEVLGAPRHPYTRGLLKSAPSIRGRVERLVPIPGSPPDLTAEPVGCPFAPRCPLARDECRVRPRLRPIGPDRQSACHFAEEVL